MKRITMLNKCMVFVVYILLFFSIFENTLGDLQVHLKLDGNLVDSAGGDNNGTLINGSRGTNQYVQGKLNQALDLNNGDYTTDGDGVSINYTMTDSGSVSLWFKPRRLYNYNSIFDNSINQDDWEMWIYGDSRVRFRIQDGNIVTANLNSLSSDGNAVEKWFHIAVTWTKTGSTTASTAMYVNGVLIDESSDSWVAPGNKFYLAGGNTGNDFGDGIWDDVRIYDHVLSDVEIRSLAMKGLSIEPKELKLTESQTGSYMVALDYTEENEPEDTVYVVITPGMDLSINGLEAGQSETLTFEPGNYLNTQTVEVTAVDDSINTGDRRTTLIHEVVSDDQYWDNMEDAQVSVLIYENDMGCGEWGYAEMDFNQDCYVDLSDFCIFASKWLTCTDPSSEDCYNLSHVIIVAHRGNSVSAPENTIAACNESRGVADMVEFDVRVTLDNQLILMHDGSVDRTTNGTGSVGSYTFAELRSLDAGSWFSQEYSGELVPLLSEAILANLPDMVPFIERKTGDAALYVDLINALRVEKEVIIISFDWNFLKEVEALSSIIKTGALGSETLSLADVQSIQSNGIDFIDWEHSGITAEIVNMVHAEGMELHVWTVNEESRMQTLIDYGIDGITTDNPSMLRRLIQ